MVNFIRFNLSVLLLAISCTLFAQNNALDFDGTDDHIVSSSSVSTSLNQTCTIEAWVNIDSQSESIFAGIGTATSLGIGMSSSGEFLSKGQDAGSQIHNSGYVLETGLWYHVAAVFNGGSSSLYVNGIEVSPSTSCPNLASGSDFYTVARGTFGSTVYFNGKIDEVRIWNDVRTQTELRKNMFTELSNPASETDLAVYFSSNETSGTTLNDSKGSNHGTLTNMAGTEWTTSSAFFGPKKCLDFDGSDDFVTSSTIATISTKTICAWVKLDNTTQGGGAVVSIENNDVTNEFDAIVYNETGEGWGFGSGFWNRTSWSNINETSTEWIHIAATYADNDYKLYRNGVIILTHDEDAVYTFNNNPRIAIGKRHTKYSGSEYHLEAQIDDVQVWNTVKTADEIRELMYTTLTGNEGGLVTYYTFDNTAGTTLQDFTGNYDGTLTSMDPATDWVSSSAFNIWMDVNNTNWNTGSNWSRGNVPTSTSNVGIFNWGGNNPIIPTGQTTLQNLFIGTGVSMNLSAGESLSINESLLTYGTFSVASSGMGASGTGSLIIGRAAIGDITFQRYVDVIAKADKWHYVSSPVSSQEISTTWLDDNLITSTPDYQFYRYDELYNYWIKFGSTGSPVAFGDESFVDARGYLLTRSSAGPLSFTGEVRTGDITYTATYTVDEGTGNNLVGNPFTSFLNATSVAHASNNFLTANAALLDDSFEALYIWDEASGYDGSNQDYKVISNVPISVGNTVINQDYIAPGQAFMVKVNSPGGNLLFNENMQSHTGAAFYKDQKETWPSLEIKIQNANLVNYTSIAFNENMTPGLDPSYDAAKIKGNPEIALYTRLVEDNGHDFALQALNFQNIEEQIIPVGVDISEAAVFEFSAVQEKLNNYNILLEDREENVFTDLQRDSYHAEISESGTGRFYLHFKDATAIGESSQHYNIQIYASNKQITITGSDKGNVTISDVMGRIVLKENISGSGLATIQVNLKTGIHLVTVQSGNEIVTKKVFIK